MFFFFILILGFLDHLKIFSYFRLASGLLSHQTLKIISLKIFCDYAMIKTNNALYVDSAKAKPNRCIVFWYSEKKCRIISSVLRLLRTSKDFICLNAWKVWTNTRTCVCAHHIKLYKFQPRVLTEEITCTQAYADHRYLTHAIFRILSLQTKFPYIMQCVYNFLFLYVHLYQYFACTSI